MAVALAPTAAAHDTITDSEPAQDAVLDVAPTEIVLTFSAEVLDLPAGILVTDSAGTTVAEGEPELEGRSVTLDLPPALEDGSYEVLWSVVSSDGHRTEDAYTFTVAAGETESELQTTPSETQNESPTTQSPTQAPVASPAADDDSSSSPAPGWPTVVMVLVPVVILLGVLLAAVAYRRRRRG